MDVRAERIGKNEAIFREANEQLAEIHRTFSSTDSMTLVCECADATCTERVTISLADYRHVRHDPTLFLVKPNHAMADFEDVVTTADTYWVVKKRLSS